MMGNFKRKMKRGGFEKKEKWKWRGDFGKGGVVLC
jgi:hypothetical protein